MTIAFTQLRHVFENLKKMLALAWEMDRRLTLGYFLTGMLSALAPLIASLTLRYLIDTLLAAQSSTGNVDVPLMVVVILATRYILNLVESIIRMGFHVVYFDHLFRYKLQDELSERFYRKLSNLDIAHLEDSKTQDLISKARDTFTWRPPEFLRQSAYLLNSIVSYITAFIVLLPYGWWIPFLITLATLPRLYLITRYATIQWSIYGSGAPQVKKLWYLTWLLANPGAIREIRLFQSQRALLAMLGDLQGYLFNLNKKPVNNYRKQLTYPPILETIVLFIIAYLQLPDVITAVISLGSFTLFINMTDQLSASTANAVSNFGEMYEHNLYVDHYFEVLTLRQLIKEADDPIVFHEITSPRIELRNVSFHYPNGPDVLKNISFIVDKGESVALVGINGAGKSTIIKLICRFYDVTGGEILINDVPITQLQLANWYKHMGTLFQDSVHYYLTVKDNIILGAPGREDEEQMVQAAKQAGAYDFIHKLPEKFNQVLGREYEDGEELSVGQWQKLAIARVFYQASPLLILDEPTSAIDAEAEYEIAKNLEKAYEDKTLILVSHRLSTLKDADKILVIENGEIIESGKHKELVKQNGKYASMFFTQAKGYK